MTISRTLLAWYDGHARDLPWRVGPRDRASGVRPDPYHVWLSEIMLQQTTVQAVRSYFIDFARRWPTVFDLAGAPEAEIMAAWAGLGYYARARNLIACARVVAGEFGGHFPDRAEDLIKLPGIGPYTTAAIAAIAFDRAETVVDGNVERVMARLYAIAEPLPASKPILRDRAATLTPDARPGDYAQAVMDLGATICTPKSPACGICPVAGECMARAAGIAAELPARSPKRAKPVRHGIAYVARDGSGAWLLERRPPRGLLGGTLGWPGTVWGETAPEEAPPFAATWHDRGAEVRHTFTHFHLILSLRLAQLDRPGPDGFEALPAHGFDPRDLPSVMRKAHDLAADWPGWN